MIKYLLIILFIASKVSYSQPHLEWVAKFKEDSNSATLTDITTDKNGNIFVTGGIGRSNGGNLFFLKYNSSGNLIWQKFFKKDTTYSLPTWGNKIAVDEDGSIYICGGTKITQSSEALIIIKYKPSGDTAWIRYHSYDSSGYAKQIIIDKFGNVYLCGYPLITKFDKAGNLLWQALPPFGIGLKEMALDSNQNVYILAEKENFYTEFLTLKYNSNGKFQWARNYRRERDSFPYSIACDGNSNVYVAGVIANIQHEFFYTQTLIKYSSVGDTLFVKDFSVAVGSTILMFNDTINYLGGGWPLRFNTNGDVYWTDSSGTPPPEHQIDNLGNLYSSEIYTQNNINNILLKKYLPSGKKVWEKQTSFTDTVSLNQSFLHIDKDNNLILAINYLHPPNVHSDTIAIYKYSQTTGIHNSGNEVVKDYRLYQNYPNPFNPATNIKFSIPKTGFITIKVYDALGREIKELLNENIRAGSYTIAFDGTNFSSGIYFYTFIADDFKETKKMTLIK